MIIYRALFASVQSCYRCDQCGVIRQARTQRNEQTSQEGIQVPVGWVIPSRAHETPGPQTTPEVYCSFACLAAHDGLPPELAEPQPVEEGATA
jgi:hypothetical protein